MRAPYSTDGMNSFGIEPPKILFSNATLSFQPSFLSVLGVQVAAVGAVERLDVDRRSRRTDRGRPTASRACRETFVGLAGDRLAGS